METDCLMMLAGGDKIKRTHSGSGEERNSKKQKTGEKHDL